MPAPETVEMATTPLRNARGQFVSTTPGSTQRQREPGFYESMDAQLVDGISKLFIATRKGENREHRVNILKEKVASLEIQLVLYRKVLEMELGELSTLPSGCSSCRGMSELTRRESVERGNEDSEPSRREAAVDVLTPATTVVDDTGED